MPRFDNTGPNGAGVMTGRRMGNCAGAMNYGFGCGMRNGFGRKFGFGRRLSKADEKIVLEDEKKMLKEELLAIDEELNSLEVEK